MTKREEILNELNGITAAAEQFSPMNPYQVPSGYFEHLPEAILSRIKAEEQVFRSPNEELEVLSPLLAKLDKKMPFAIPEGYFTELTPKGFMLVNKMPEAKVVHISSARKALRFSIAAAVIGLIAIGTWFLTKNTTSETKYASAQEVIQKVQKLSDPEISAYFEENATSAESVYQNTAVSDEIKNEDVKLMLADLSDQELEFYVAQDNAATSELN